MQDISYDLWGLKSTYRLRTTVLYKLMSDSCNNNVASGYLTWE